MKEPTWYREGMRVIATCIITDDGGPPDYNAAPVTPGFVTAAEDDVGTVEMMVDDDEWEWGGGGDRDSMTWNDARWQKEVRLSGTFMVRFDRTGCACTCQASQVAMLT